MLFVQPFSFSARPGCGSSCVPPICSCHFSFFFGGGWAALSPQRLHPDHRHSTNTLLVMDAGLGFTRVSSRSRPSFPMPPSILTMTT